MSGPSSARRGTAVADRSSASSSSTTTCSPTTAEARLSRSARRTAARQSSTRSTTADRDWAACPVGATPRPSAAAVVSRFCVAVADFIPMLTATATLNPPPHPGAGDRREALATHRPILEPRSTRHLFLLDIPGRDPARRCSPRLSGPDLDPHPAGSHESTPFPTARSARAALPGQQDSGSATSNLGRSEAFYLHRQRARRTGDTCQALVRETCAWPAGFWRVFRNDAAGRQRTASSTRRRELGREPTRPSDA